jgi:prospero homeobox 1
MRKSFKIDQFRLLSDLCPSFQVPPNFRFVVEQTLREFFRAIQGGKDTEQSWKKSIYKVISRMDDPVPEYFKSPNFLEQLE